METIELQSFFEQVGYSWREDADTLAHICMLTKTRAQRTRHPLARRLLDLLPSALRPGHRSVDYFRQRMIASRDHASAAFEFAAGMEQPFLMKALAESLNCRDYFEIGTGRGTSCYALSMVPSVQRVVTVDIVPFTRRQSTAVAGQPAYLSNSDIFSLVQIEEKRKIEFCHTSDYQRILSACRDSFDLAFIDGNHTDTAIIRSDFRICLDVVREGGTIAWDDYDPRQFAVKGVVDEAIAESGFEAKLVEFRGHLFGDGRKEKGAGMAIMKIAK